MGSKRKRSHSHHAKEAGIQQQSKPALPPLPEIEAAPFKLVDDAVTTTTVAVSSAPFREPEKADEGEWEVARPNKKAKKEKAGKKNYPEFVVSPQKLKDSVKLKDLQGLVLWLTSNAPAPQWLLVRHKPEIRRVVCLMVPGLTMNMFDGPLAEMKPEYDQIVLNKKPSAEPITGRDYPRNLEQQKLDPVLQDLADMFPVLWPVQTPGDDRNNKMHSPINAFLTAPLPKDAGPTASGPSKKKITVTDLLMSLEELISNEYPLHSSQITEIRLMTGDEETDEDRQLLAQRKSEGWVETDLSKSSGADKNQSGSILDGKTIYSLDCEMCRTADGTVLTRISVLDWDSNVIYDTLVKPSATITDYLTEFSGMTEELLKDVTTTLEDVQNHLLTLFNADTILVGQSLNSDLVAMKYSHPHIIDTSCIYHHARGPPYKASLKWLTQRFLKKDIQTGGAAGHDSIEDARACLELLKLKLEKGMNFGTSDDNRESIFKRLTRPPGPKKTAMIDYGDPKKFHPDAVHSVSVKNDDEVVKEVQKAMEGSTEEGIPVMDLVFAQLRDLQKVRNFTTDTNGQGRKIDIDGPLPEVVKDPPVEEVIKATKETVERIRKIYESLPKCTAFIIFSGSGDPRKWRQMCELQKRFKEEYKVRKWDEVSVQWTDTEDQILKRSLNTARRGCAFLVVK
ncbi:hypothetical protein BZA77DRAFT_276302 [Pyronema omphalodes]|nr:hypothetical protein BZA77DRAFT_276302 [Pyronema omphalodes]